MRLGGRAAEGRDGRCVYGSGLEGDLAGVECGGGEREDGSGEEYPVASSAGILLRRVAASLQVTSRGLRSAYRRNNINKIAETTIKTENTRRRSLRSRPSRPRRPR